MGSSTVLMSNEARLLFFLLEHHDGQTSRIEMRRWYATECSDSCARDGNGVSKNGHITRR